MPLQTGMGGKKLRAVPDNSLRMAAERGEALLKSYGGVGKKEAAGQTFEGISPLD